MQPSKLNKIKKAVCFLVIFSLVLQISFYPLVANAASGGGLWAKLVRIFSKITVPDKVGMDKDGAVKLGEWEIYQFRNANNQEVNPFNNIGEVLFEKQEENLLIKDGKLTIATPEVPEVCQLGLIKPIEKGGSGLDENEQLARRRACNYLIRLQTAAAQEAFVAKSIYTKTNPKGDCLFLQNCKSVCSLRFGEIKYVVTLFDIAEFLLPTGWMSVIYKIVNIVAMFGEIQTVLTAAKDILTDGISLVNSAISTFNYLVNLFESLQSLGGNLSASLGVAAVLAQGALGGIGGDVGMGIDIGTGVAAGVVTGITLVKSGAGMKEMLGRFADNMLAYGQAKTEASQTLLGIKGDLINVIEGGESIKGLKKEERLSFLFKPQNETDQQKKDFLNKAVTEYRAFFENSTELLERMSMPGDLLGQTVLEVTTGTTEDFNNLNGKPNFIKAYEPGDPVETIYGDRTFDKSFCLGGASGGYEFDEVYKPSLGVPGGGPRLLEITEPSYVISILDSALGAANPDTSMNYNMAELDESKSAWVNYWRELGRIVLGTSEMNRIDIMNAEDCRLKCRFGYMQYEVINKSAFNGRVFPFLFLKSIASLDRVPESGELYGAGATWGSNRTVQEINYAKDNNRQKTISFLNSDYASTRLQSPTIKFPSLTESDNICVFAGDRVSPWPSSCPSGTGNTNPLKTITEKDYVLDTIKSALGGIEDDHYDMKVLNYTKGAWKDLWKDIGNNVLPSGRTQEIIDHNTPEKAHQILMSECVAKYPFLAYLKAHEGDWYGRAGAVEATEQSVDFFVMQRDASNAFPITCVDIPNNTWFKAFQLAYADIKGLATFFGETDPKYLRKRFLEGVPTSFMNCFQSTGDCQLDATNEAWRQYWEGIATSLLGWDVVQPILHSEIPMQQRLDALQSRTTLLYTPLAFLTGLEGAINIVNESWTNPNTQILIKTWLNRYETARNAPNLVGFKYFTQDKILKAVNDVTQLGFHEKDLENNKQLPGPASPDNIGPRYINGEYRKYWQSKIWCGDCSVDKFSNFKKTYDAGIAEMEWGERIKAMAQSSKNLLLVDEAIRANLSPEEPLINYKIEKANKAFYNAVTQTQEKFYNVVNNLTYADPCYLAGNFHWGVKNYTDYPDQQWYECPSDANYCCNKSDCQTKLNSALNICGEGTPNSEGEWWNFYWKAYQKYNFFNNWFYNFAGYKQVYDSKGDYSPIYTPFEEKYVSTIINDIQVIIKALDFIWQNDMSEKIPDNKVEKLKRDILSKITHSDDSEVDYLVNGVKDYYQGLTPNSKKGSEIIRKYIANILATNYLNEQLIAYYGWGRIDRYKKIFESDDWNNMLSPDEMIAKINSWPAWVGAAKKQELKDTIEGTFALALSNVKAETIESFKNNIGKYPFEGSWVNLSNYTEAEVCPAGIEAQGFQNRVACFEWRNKITFTNLSYPLQAMTKLENAIFNLADATLDADGMSSIRESINNLKPSIRTDMKEINENMVGDFSLTKILQPFKDAWNKYTAPDSTPEPPGSPKVQVTKDSGDITNWKDLKEALLNNPITFLEGEFSNIENQIAVIRRDLVDAQAWLGDGGYLWPRINGNPDPSYDPNYDKAITEVSGNRITKLNALVSGNENRMKSCQGFSVLMSQALPQEISQTCKLVVDGGKRDPSILGDAVLINKCSDLEVAFDLDTNLSPEDLEKQIQLLEESRKCIVKENCNIGEDKCIKCPEWFCLNPASNTWTSDESLDVKCASHPRGYYNKIIWDPALQIKDRQWPPTSNCPCEPTNLYCLPQIAQNFQSAQASCISTQIQLDLLKKQRVVGAPDIEATKEECKELEYQKALKIECEGFEVAQKASQNNCNDLPTSAQKTSCSGLRAQATSNLCDGNAITNLNCNIFPGGFPDLTSQAPENQKALADVKDLCYEVQDIKKPLNEIMKVYSVLIGIRSGTLAYGGIKSSVADAKKLVANIQKFIKMVEELPKKMGAALDGVNKKSVKGGIKITPLKCVAKPAESYDAVSGRIKTGPEGGQVCPEVGTLYKQLQSQFAVIRNELHQIDLSRREVSEINIPLGKKERFIHIFDTYPIRHPSIDPLYDRAQSIKEKAQYVWALATAIDFANQQCTCGQSFCKLPFCVSGLPLTLQPLKDPYCSLVWLLRVPMYDMAESLNQELKTLPDNLQ